MKKTPFVTKEQVEEIAKTYPTPFHIYDEKGIRENARKLKAAFSWNKGYREYFAVKATPNPYILKILQEEGCGVDCSSLTELMMSEACGFHGSDIMFSSNVTPAEEYKKAKALDAYINLDDITHIDFLKKKQVFRRLSAVVTIRAECSRWEQTLWITLRCQIRYDKRTDERSVQTLKSNGSQTFWEFILSLQVIPYQMNIILH